MAGVVWMCFLFKFFSSLRMNTSAGPEGELGKEGVPVASLGSEAVVAFCQKDLLLRLACGDSE